MEYLTTQHQHKYASSVISSETLSGISDSRNNRIRTVRLVRPNHWNVPPPTYNCRHGPSLGFSLRGGREHGTGFFVSNIEPGSEAQRQGLRIGDQIIRVNGYTIEDAVHKEVLQLISNHTHLTLKVRGVGMIPVKDNKMDTLSWQIISDNFSLRSTPPLGENVRDVRVNMTVAPKSKLGCGICKGPEWKPGIFVQFTKEAGIAREAGLRPGDQILYCNNVDFSDISFKEAVNIMKSSRQLDLIVRKAAGSELFPGESSGYNSSASSVTGDQSPSWSDLKRLSIVKEETLDLEDRLSQLGRLKFTNSNKWKSIEWDEPEPDKQFFKPTIINLSENGTTIENNGTEEALSTEYNENSNRPLNQQETKTVVVEVHRSDIEEKAKNEQQRDLAKSSSTSSFGSLISNTSSSLSSAICQEIQRRSQKNGDSKPSIDEQLQLKKIVKGVSNEKQYQHNKLMDEFKKAHQKMFKPLDGDKSTLEKEERLAELELSRTLSERLISLSLKDTKQNSSVQDKFTSVPPPPPPMPNLENELNGSQETLSCSSTLKPNKSKSKAPPVPVKYSTLSYNKPPPCPTPDYDTLSITSTTSHNNVKSSQHNNNNDTVEMESLESFRINNPSQLKPKPPNTYFQKSPETLPNGFDYYDQREVNNCRRPISITIGEYPTLRKQPGKLDFLQNRSNEEPSMNGKESPITTQFASELARTLTRSQLRKRTESMEDLLCIGNHIKPQSNGSVRISLKSNLNRSLAKSTNDLSSLNYSMKTVTPKSRVMVNSNFQHKKQETYNGILKNNNVYSSHKPIVQQKSITFGELPTIIKDHPLKVK